MELREQLKDIEYSDDFDNEIERIKAREELQESYVRSLTEGSNNRVAELNVTTKDFAQLSMKNLDSAIQKVSNQNRVRALQTGSLQ